MSRVLKFHLATRMLETESLEIKLSEKGFHSHYRRCYMEQLILEYSKRESGLFSLIVSFPTVYIWYAIIADNNNMRVFYVAYFMLIFIVFCGSEKGKIRISKTLFCLIGIIVIKWCYDLLAYPNSMSDAIELGILYVILYITADVKFRMKYYTFIQKRHKLVMWLSVAYLIAVSLTFILGTSYTNVWGTVSIQGPYGLAHIFAYELLVLACNSYLLLSYTAEKKWFIFLVIFCGLIALTTARTVLLCLLVMISYWFITKKGVKKFLYAFVGSLALIFIFRYTPLFTYVIQKTANAAKNGSITNYRREIWFSSWQCFLSGNPTQKLLGQGMVALQKWNLSYVRMQVQAHNDFITVITSFGLVSCVLYFCLLVRQAKGKGMIGMLISVAVLIVFNGMYSYCSFVIGIISIRLFFDTVSQRIG